MNDLSRRHFMEAVAASAAGTMLLPRLARAQGLIRGTILDRSTRMSAAHWGMFEAETVGERVTQVSPFAKDPNAPSPVLQALADRVYSPTRVKYPMVREGYLKNGPKSDTAERGRGNFVRVSWGLQIGRQAFPCRRILAE